MHHSCDAPYSLSRVLVNDISEMTGLTFAILVLIYTRVQQNIFILFEKASTSDWPRIGLLPPVPGESILTHGCYPMHT